MEKISNSCKKGNCEYCHEDDLGYEELIALLSEMHVTGTKKPEVLHKAKPLRDFKKDSPNFEKIKKMQRELFTLAYNNFLPWAREYYEY